MGSRRDLTSYLFWRDKVSVKNKKEWVRENSPTDTMGSEIEYSIILFDGFCNLCNRWVNFVIDHDPEGKFRFASLQSETGQRVLLEYGSPENFPDSIVFVENGQCFLYSTSILRIIRRLNGVWPMLFVFTVIPETIRDWIYRWVASRRYQWFGKQDTCRKPTPDLEARFLK